MVNFDKKLESESDIFAQNLFENKRSNAPLQLNYNSSELDAELQLQALGFFGFLFELDLTWIFGIFFRFFGFLFELDFLGFFGFF